VLVALAVLAGGCLTQRGKVACKRAEIVLTDRGANGDALAAACGAEMAQVNMDTGACSVALTAADITPEAAAANSAAIQAARETRAMIWGYAKTIAQKAAESWPPLAGILGALGLAGGLFAKLRQYRQTAETLVEGVGKIAHPDTKTAIRTLAIDYGLQPFLDRIVQRVDPPKE
jgi:hypothetical protein